MNPAAYPKIRIMLDNASGTPTDISAYVDASRGVVVETDTKRYTYTPMSTGIEVEIPGSQRKTINLEVFDIPEAHTFFDAIFRQSGLDLTIEADPEGGSPAERNLAMVVTCTHVGSVGFFDGIYRFPVTLSVQSGPTEL